MGEINLIWGGKYEEKLGERFCGVYMRAVQFWGVFEGVQGIFL